MNQSSSPSNHIPVLALSREETACALGVSATTVDRLTKARLLTPSRVTRRPMYPIWEVERFLRESIELRAKANPDAA